MSNIAATSGLLVASQGALCIPDVPPPPALAAGYTVRTLGPAPTLNTALYPFTFFASSNPDSSQNSDGTLYLSGINTLYNASVCTAKKDTGKLNNWGGLAFGGGAYFECVFLFTGAVGGAIASWPAFWMNDIEHMCNGSVALYQWPGQAAGYGDWEEVDIMEFDAQNISQYGIAAHNWYAGPAVGGTQQVNTHFGAISIGTNSFANFQTYGLLWIPATAVTSGSATWYFNNTAVGSVTWSQYDAGLAPPPVAGTSGYSIADVKHFCPIIGTSNTSMPVTVLSCSVWQTSTVNNWQQ